MKLVSAASHDVNALQVDLSIISLHAAGSVAHAKVSK